MMMKSVFWWRKPEYPEETTDLRQVTVENFHFSISRLAWMIEDLSILISCIFMSVSDNSATNSAALVINLSALTKLSAFLLPGPCGTDREESEEFGSLKRSLMNSFVKASSLVSLTFEVVFSADVLSVQCRTCLLHE